jgi:predicted GH43/DUF377 family glycosyl hydrolase
MKQRYIYIAAILFFTTCAEKPSPFDQLSSFSKPVSYPILTRDSTAVFFDSLKNENVYWKKADVFNPAAIVKNDTIFCFRGVRIIRLQFFWRTHIPHWESTAARTEYILLHMMNLCFTRPGTVFDIRLSGWAEDPRIQQTEDGLYVLAYTSWNYKVPVYLSHFQKIFFSLGKEGWLLLKPHRAVFFGYHSKSDL